MIILNIDTSSNKIIKVALDMNGEKKELTVNLEKGAQTTLSLIEKLLLENKIKLSDIDKIKVKKRPGSFTGLRVGVSIANALSFALLKPVNNKDLSKPETPVY